jgi:Holliday junction resolvase RusA-like endonuclease
MMVVYDMFVCGLPKAQPRPRMTKTGHVYTPGSANEWKESVSAEIMLHRRPMITLPVKLTVCFYFPFPKREKPLIEKPGCFRPHISKPDADNLLKAVMDSMTAASVWVDDTQVYLAHTEKWYSAGEHGARIKVEAFES